MSLKWNVNVGKNELRRETLLKVTFDFVFKTSESMTNVSFKGYQLLWVSLAGDHAKACIEYNKQPLKLITVESYELLFFNFLWLFAIKGGPLFNRIFPRSKNQSWTY